MDAEELGKLRMWAGAEGFFFWARGHMVQSIEFNVTNHPAKHEKFQATVFEFKASSESP